MDELSNKKIDDNMLSIQAESLSLEKEIENHDAGKKKENDIIIEFVALEKRPIIEILFVDDEVPIQNLFKDGLEKSGYTVKVASNGNDGIRLFRENPVDLIITDLFMPEKNGHDFIYEIIREFPGTKVFAITGQNTILGQETELDIAYSLGAIEVFTKPVKLKELLFAINEL